MSAAILTATSNSKWIISKRDDLLFFIGSALPGYLIVALAILLGELPSRFLVAFALAIDGPHVYSTATRALLDDHERARLRMLWLVALPLCLMIAPGVPFAIGSDWTLVVIASLSHYHISKQHMGFVMLYKRKAGERTEYKKDRYFTLASLILPFLFYLSAMATGGPTFLPVFLVPATLIVLLYVRRQRINPKLLLLVAFIPLQWIAWGYAATNPHSVARLLTAGMATNVGHSLQYLRLMYFHNHNRYSERPNLLGLISTKWIYFFTAAAVLSGTANLVSKLSQQTILRSAVLGFLLFHFLVDARIWRVRGDTELAYALKLNSA